MDIENYRPKRSQVESHDGRYAVVYAPDIRPPVGSIISASGTAGRVAQLLGGERFRVDFLAATVEPGDCEVEMLDRPAAIGPDLSRASDAEWVESGVLWNRARGPAILTHTRRPVFEALDLCAPLVSCGVHIAFMSDALTPTFFAPNRTFGAGVGFQNDAVCGIDVFARLIAEDEDVLMFVEERQLDAIPRFLDAVPTSATVIVCAVVTPGFLTIIETMNVANVATTWVVDQDGRVDLLRSGSAHEHPRGAHVRAERQRAFDEQLFAALIDGPSEAPNDDPILFVPAAEC